MTRDTSGINREDKGVPTGGRFAEDTKTEAPADVTLPATEWRQIGEDEFEDEYGPVCKPDGDILWQDDDLVGVNTTNIWTIVDVDGDLYAKPGFAFVNRTGDYVVTEKPWIHDNQEAIWHLDQTEHEDGICDNCTSPVDGFDVCPDCDTPVPETDPSVIAAETLSNAALVDAGREATALNNPLAATAGRVTVEFESIGEGDYGESGPFDENGNETLLRVTATVTNADGEQEYVDGGSWCTRVPVDVDPELAKAWLAAAAEKLNSTLPAIGQEDDDDYGDIRSWARQAANTTVDDLKPETKYNVRVKGRIKHTVSDRGEADRLADAEQANYPDASVTVRIADA